jgi:hypothetical protein
MWGFLGGKSRKAENEGELGYWLKYVLVIVKI